MLTDYDLVKAKRDVTRCLVCLRRFNSDDVRQNVYKDDKFIGVIHDVCYDLVPLRLVPS